MHPLRSTPTRIAVIAVGALVCGAPALRAFVHDHTAEPEPGETFGVAEFRIYVPESVPRLRGVLFRVAPHLADSRPDVHDPLLQKLATGGEFALMGARLEDMHMETGIGNAVLRTLEVFATASGRPELAFATLYLEGYSWGGQFSYHFTLWRPERVLGFVTMKGGYHSTAPAGAAILVPGYLFVGENDLPYRIENLTGIFEAHRRLGARWIMAVEPGAGHEPITDRALLDEHFVTVIQQRLPADWPLDEVPELAVLPEVEAWLGNRADFRIGAWDCYDAAPDSASWLVTRAVAATWQTFVSAGAVADTIDCPVTAVSRPDPLARLLAAHPNPANPATRIRFELARAAAAVSLRVFDVSGKLVRTLLDREPRAAGRHEAAWDGRDDRGRIVPAGVYFVRLTTGMSSASGRATLVK
jgi:dienelactone hydrolase